MWEISWGQGSAISESPSTKELLIQTARAWGGASLTKPSSQGCVVGLVSWLQLDRQGQPGWTATSNPVVLTCLCTPGQRRAKPCNTSLLRARAKCKSQELKLSVPFCDL